MRLHLLNLLKSSNRQLFYVEQWAALIIGVVCIGSSMWATLHGPASGQAAHSDGFLGRAVIAPLWWSLSSASALIGVCLLRFAFSKEPEMNAGPSFGRPQLRRRERAKRPRALRLLAHDERNG